MFLLGPLLTAGLLQRPPRAARRIATIGVLAKEFAAAPLWIFTLWAALQRKWELLLRSAAGGVDRDPRLADAASFAHRPLQLQLRRQRLRRTCFTAATSRIAYALVGFRGALMAVFVEFGALYLLLPFGWWRASRELRLLAVAAIPAALALSYVQQPDRALWNFHFLVIPVAVLVLEQLPGWAAGLFIALFALANLRVGAQLSWAPPAVASIALSSVVAARGGVHDGPRAAPAAGDGTHMTFSLRVVALGACGRSGRVCADAPLPSRTF